MLEKLQSNFRQVAPGVEYCSLRFVQEEHEGLSLRQNVPEPLRRSVDVGAMITVIDCGAIGYAATSDLSVSGLSAAARQALRWARLSQGRSVTDFSKVPMPHPVGSYATPVVAAWESVSTGEKYQRLAELCASLKIADAVVDWSVGLQHVRMRTVLMTADGGLADQRMDYILPSASVSAHGGGLTQSRGFGPRHLAGGLEVLDAKGFWQCGPALAGEAIELLTAPNCPSGAMDVLLAPDQMHLQIHESIGHPLEMDRILGDERNFAGTSFVRPEMVGTFRYGSELLNVSYDPTRAEQFGTFTFDDEGSEACKKLLIERGILKALLGGVTSQARSGLPGVATARSCGWNRPPIDRMSNLNLEPGNSTLEEMIASVERGIYMKSNTSWSIDDSRNKFQFGCQWGRLIEDGRLTTVVRNPNYRGISGTFWRSLAMVGNADSVEALGTPNCGKGEPSQILRVGHASPPCLFRQVDVFGGARP